MFLTLKVIGLNSGQVTQSLDRETRLAADISLLACPCHMFQGQLPSPHEFLQTGLERNSIIMLRIPDAVKQSHISTFGGIQGRSPSDQFSLIIPRNSKDIPFCRSTNPTSRSPAPVSTHQLPS